MKNNFKFWDETPDNDKHSIIQLNIFFHPMHILLSTLPIAHGFSLSLLPSCIYPLISCSFSQSHPQFSTWLFPPKFPTKFFIPNPIISDQEEDQENFKREYLFLHTQTHLYISLACKNSLKVKEILDWVKEKQPYIFKFCWWQRRL